MRGNYTGKFIKSGQQQPPLTSILPQDYDIHAPVLRPLLLRVVFDQRTLVGIPRRFQAQGGDTVFSRLNSGGRVLWDWAQLPASVLSLEK